MLIQHHKLQTCCVLNDLSLDELISIHLFFLMRYLFLFDLLDLSHTDNWFFGYSIGIDRKALRIETCETTTFLFYCEGAWR